MALFKSLRGKRENLPSTRTDGYAYFCTDDGTFWIDYKDENNNVHRKQLNAKEAELLSGVSLAELQNSINGKADSSHNHDDRYYTESEVDALLKEGLDTKSNTGHTHIAADITDLKEYTEAEIQALWDAAQPLGTFTIADDTALNFGYPTGNYQFEIGMTFTQWASSSYNTIGAISADGNVGFNDASYDMVCIAGASEKIVDGQIYTYHI